MAGRHRTDDSLRGVGVIIFGALAAIAVVAALYWAALQPPGEGVPGPAEWARVRHEQAQTGP